MMTAAALPTTPMLTPLQRFVGPILALFGYRQASVSFVVGEDGELTEMATTITLTMEKHETIEAFHARLRRDHLRPGDTLTIFSQAGRLDAARIVRQPR